MNSSITISKSDGLEIRNYENSDVPFDYYFATTKRKDSIFLANKHSDVELLFVTGGKIKIHLDDEVFLGERGDIIVIHPNVLHNVIVLSEVATYECLIIDRQYLDKNGLSLEECRVEEKIKDENLFDLIHPIKSSILNRPPFYRTKANVALLQLCIGLFEHHSTARDKHLGPSSLLLSIEESIRYINKHFASEITVDAIAAHIGYSKFYFCRKFKEVTGYTPTVYINMQRIKYAYHRLCESNDTVNEVAFSCGFQSLAYFSATFKKYIGIPPSGVKNNKKQ